MAAPARWMGSGPATNESSVSASAAVAVAEADTMAVVAVVAHAGSGIKVETFLCRNSRCSVRAGNGVNGVLGRGDADGGVDAAGDKFELLALALVRRLFLGDKTLGQVTRANCSDGVNDDSGRSRN